MKIKRYEHADNSIKSLYGIGLILILPIVCIVLFLRTDFAIDCLIKANYTCSIRKLTGFLCPGCGGTRAAIYLARFRFADSFLMNPVVPVGAMLYIIFMVTETLHVFFGTKGFCEKTFNILLAVLIVTVILKTIISNYMLIRGV